MDGAGRLVAVFVGGRSGGLSTIVGLLPDLVVLAGSADGLTSFLRAPPFLEVEVVGLVLEVVFVTALELAMPSLSLSCSFSALRKFDKVGGFESTSRVPTPN